MLYVLIEIAFTCLIIGAAFASFDKKYGGPAYRWFARFVPWKKQLSASAEAAFFAEQGILPRAYVALVLSIVWLTFRAMFGVDVVITMSFIIYLAGAVAGLTDGSYFAATFDLAASAIGRIAGIAGTRPENMPNAAAIGST